MNSDRLLSLLGLARRAGRLSLGNDAAISSVEDGASALVLLANDVSPRTAKGVELAAEDAAVDVMRIAHTMDEISMALGKRCGVVSVDDAGFAKKARTLITMSREETNI
ncbi:MAG: 50S ribosomal protein L7ae [Clostridiales bacterium]|jgi:ribosomal protein L7Ae-like RNA K-turn-binding protein|nr:50S ribosomal protein L7ae [Clostridiales bacterium]